MTPSVPACLHVAIACGGTGGHLFPGLAVAEQLRRHGVAVSVMISPKEVDQQAVRSVTGMEVVTLPAVAWQRGSRLACLRGFLQSWRSARRWCSHRRPAAVLAMGGFTAVAPVLAGRGRGGKTFLHESNTVPGKANRWLASRADETFVGFPEAARRLNARRVAVTGTPVRAELRSGDMITSRMELGLQPDRPVVLVMGGSQGASRINHLVMAALPHLTGAHRDWQWLHLAGARDVDMVRAAYATSGVTAVVHPFLHRMNLALHAATVCVSRAGAASLAELAAVRLPAILIPLPEAADNHQWHNARAYAESGAALLLEQHLATAGNLLRLLQDLTGTAATVGTMRAALAKWDHPGAAENIAGRILRALGQPVAAGNPPAAEPATTAEESGWRQMEGLVAV